MCSVLALSFYCLHVCLSRGTQRYSRHEKRKIIKDLQALTLDTPYLLRGNSLCPSRKRSENVALSYDASFKRITFFMLPAVAFKAMWPALCNRLFISVTTSQVLVFRHFSQRFLSWRRWFSATRPAVEFPSGIFEICAVFPFTYRTQRFHSGPP